MYVGLIESICPLGPQRMGLSENCVTDQRVLWRGRCTWEEAAAVNLFSSGTGKSRGVRAIFFSMAEKAEILLHDKTETAEALWDFEL